MINLSVITINYNNKKGLEKTIQSVVEQEEALFEFVVIDGGSTDGSKDVIEAYSNKITYWVSEKDKGIYHAQNKGIDAASGKFLLFLNSGDCLYDKRVFSKVMSHLDDSEIVYGDIVMRSPDGIEKQEVLPDVIDDTHLMLSTIWHPGAFIQKKLFDRIGLYDETYKIAADYAFFVKAILVHKVTQRHLPFIISVFEMNGVSTDPKFFEAMLTERKKIQATYFTKEQQVKLANLEIFQAGRNSKYFKYLPSSPLLFKMYDAFYQFWYKRKLNG